MDGVLRNWRMISAMRAPAALTKHSPSQRSVECTTPMSRLPTMYAEIPQVMKRVTALGMHSGGSRSNMNVRLVDTGDEKPTKKRMTKRTAGCMNGIALRAKKTTSKSIDT